MTLSSEMYTEEYYLGVCGGHADFLEGRVAPRLERAIALGNLGPGMNVLDIGSGRGEMAARCAEMGCMVWGIDYSQAALTISSGLVRRTHVTGARTSVAFNRMNSKALAFPRGFFDRTFLIDIVEHLAPDELNVTLEEVKRVTKPGGRIIIHTAPNAWLIRPIHLVMGILFKRARHPWHVNEQSFMSLMRNIKPLRGNITLEMTKVPGFFNLGLGPTEPGSSSLARIVRTFDAIFDSSLSVGLVENTPLKFVFGTDIWATIDLPVPGFEGGSHGP